MRPLIAGILLLAACAESGPSNQASIGDDAPLNRPAAEPPPDVAEERKPVPEPSDSAQAAQAARAVLLRYFSRVEGGEWDDAADLWWDDDSAAAFAARLRQFGEFRPSIAAPQRPEGAAGSVYVGISLQLLRDSASLADGTAVLRRINDVPGSTEEQRRWRIERITLQPPPAPLSH